MWSLRLRLRTMKKRRRKPMATATASSTASSKMSDLPFLHGAAWLEAQLRVHAGAPNGARTS